MKVALMITERPCSVPSIARYVASTRVPLRPIAARLSARKCVKVVREPGPRAEEAPLKSS